MPAATAQALTARPLRALVLTIAIGVIVTWLSLSAAYYTSLPVGFLVTSCAFAGYLASLVVRYATRSMP
jgi:zinc/manganese transport system permease protein